VKRIIATSLAATVLLPAAVFGQPVPLVPFVMDYDNPAPLLVDHSGLLSAPAGKDGFIRMQEEHFVSPDGSRFRIWGMNMAGVSPFPDKEHAGRIADDLARLGINCVRFHGLDSAWGRSIIDYSRDDTLRADPVNFDRFDWLVYQLKQRGIYSNLNLNVFRVYKEGDGVRDFKPLYFGKSATYYSPRLLQLQRDFARLLLEHQNPYTGNEYRNEPAVFCVEMVNENSVLEGWVNGRLIGEDVERPSTWSPIPVSYAQELTVLYNQWLPDNIPAATLEAIRREAGAGEDGRVERLRPDQFAAASKERFFAEAEYYLSLEEGFFQMMRDLLEKEIGVKSLLCGTSDHSDGTCQYAHIRANMIMDFIDGHGYWEHPSKRDGKTWIKNTPMVNDPWDSTVTQFARTPVVGRPYTISETNHPFPHVYACEGFPILTAYSLFHDWDGIYWFTYGAGPAEEVEKGIRGSFNMSVDPMKMSTIAALAPLWHRQDIRPAKTRIVRSYTHEQIIERIRAERWKERPFFDPQFPRSTPLRFATRFTLDGLPGDEYPADSDRNRLESDTSELGWYHAEQERGIVTVDTKNTSALIGFVRASGLETDHVKVEVDNEFCTVILTSLDGRPICNAQRLLLVTTAKSTNTDFAFEEDGRTVARWGTGPTLIEPVTGRVLLKQLEDASAVKVTPLTATGKRLGDAVPVQRASNDWSIAIGEFATTWYLIEVARP
jgi:hypothetical protein